MPQDSTEIAPELQRLDPAKAARLHQALSAAGEDLLDLIHDPDPDVTRSMLRNPNLSEEHLLVILKRRRLDEQVIKSIQRLPQAAASRRLKIALAAHPETPPAVLYAVLPQLFLFELLNVTQLPGTPPDQKLAAERAILQRLPETDLGNKLTLARRGPAGILEALLKHGEPRLVEAVLENPRLKEPALLAFLNSAAATAETISAVARHQRWGCRPNLRLAILRNRKTPRVWYILLLPKLDRRDLEKLLVSKTLLPEQMAAVQEEWVRREQQQSIDNSFIKS